MPGSKPLKPQAAILVFAPLSFAISFTAVAAQNACDVEDLFLTLGEIEYVDHGREGLSVGDQRILLHHLHDYSGNRVGHVNAISTVLHPIGGPGTTIHVEGTLHLEGGRFHWTNTQTLADPQDTTRSTTDEPESVVLGGTGVFENVSGMMFVKPEGEGYRLEFDLSC